MYTSENGTLLFEIAIRKNFLQFFNKIRYFDLMFDFKMSITKSSEILQQPGFIQQKIVYNSQTVKYLY